MEVFGHRSADKGNLSLPEGSADDFELFSCQPCAGEGHHVEAEGFCQNCQEYLCITCYKYHCKPTPSRHHVLLDKDNMPKDRTSTSAKCGCGDQIVTLEKYAKSLKKGIEDDCIDINRLYAEAEWDIQACRKQVDKNLEDMEQKLLELENIHSLLTSKAKQSGDLFVQAKQLYVRLKKVREDLNYTFEKNTKIVEYFQTKHGSLGELPPAQIRNRKVVSPRRLQDLTPILVREVCVKSSADRTDCWITGMVAIAPDTLVCTDYENQSVKKIDTKTYKITSNLKLTSEPWDITHVSYDQLAVTVTEENKICVLAFRRGLSKTREIDVAGKCAGIAYSNDRLVVSYSIPAKVEILSLDGKVIQRIGTDSRGKIGKCAGIAYSNDRLVVYYSIPAKVEILGLDDHVIQRIDTVSSGKTLFRCPWYVAVDRDGNSIYVSDLFNNSVTKVTTSGKVLDAYKDTNLSYPEGIVVCSDGSVLVCNKGKDNLHLLSSEIKKIMIVLNKTEDPQTLVFNTEGDSLFMSFYGSKCNTILKYMLI